MSSKSHLSRWVLWSLAPAFFLAWIFSGCGKDSTIQISKNEALPIPAAYRDATDHLVLDPTDPPKPNQRRIRVAIKYDQPNQEVGGSVTLSDGTVVLSEVKDKDIYIIAGTDLLLKSAPTAGWQVDHWELFPGKTRNQTQTIKEKDLAVASINENQFVTLVLAPKKQVKLNIRTAGPDYHASPNPYTGYVDYKVLYLADWSKDLYAIRTGRCFPMADRRTLETSTCPEMPTMVPRNSILQLTIRHRSKELREEKKEIILNDDMTLDFTFEESK